MMKLDIDLRANSQKRLRITPEYERIKNEFDSTTQKLDILKDTKVLLKKDIFIKKQDSKMVTARRRMEKNKIRAIRRKQKAQKKSRNAPGPHDSSQFKGGTYHIDMNLESQKDRQVNQ
jgi:hypothetical protein